MTVELSSSNRIRVLPRELINQIAAGEVVDRPSSILKELFENSLDAGASRIDIDVEGGGVRLIRVRDDGHGIHHEDMALALSNHATSKIGALKDLESIGSLGFRGEALSSIDSISRLTLISRMDEDDHGWQLSGDDCNPVAHGVGTTIEVRDLFYNVPARRKFLRTEKTEFAHLEQVARRITLSVPQVAVTLKNNGRTVWSVKPASTHEDRERRVARLCGNVFMEHAVHISSEASGLKLSGWMALPSLVRNQSDLQFFYLNGRMVRDKTINHAMRQAYDDVLYTGSHPACVLFLEMPLAEVDVNVHPGKLEVRFHQSRLVHDFIYSVLRNALMESTGTTERTSLPVYSSKPTSRFAVAEQINNYGELIDTEQKPGTSYPLGEAKTFIQQRYIVAENQDGLVLIDYQHAREHLILTGLQKKEIETLPLLWPLSVNVSEQEADVFEQRRVLVEESGFEMDRIGPESILVRKLPVVFRDSNHERVVQGLLVELASDTDKAQLQIALSRYGAEIALTSEPALETLNELLRELEKSDLASLKTQTHPVVRELSADEIERLFVS
ncbi:MAG: DNA mismatch repair endonuclease MutL [Gammaproteobacteria bacterium]|nr:DNA mismatch repair endonuclease MutL [Gammaproteobacteria bacterium]